MIVWIFLLGLALIIIAIFGGGIEVKEIRVPTLPNLPRAFSFLLGLVLVTVSYWPNLLPASFGSGPSQDDPKQYAGVLPIYYTPDQTAFARTLYDFLAGKRYSLTSLSGTQTDFSEILDGDRERPGTIRIVYQSNQILPPEQILAQQIRNQYPAEAARVVESMNGSASAPLQVQLW